MRVAFLEKGFLRKAVLLGLSAILALAIMPASAFAVDPGDFKIDVYVGKYNPSDPDSTVTIDYSIDPIAITSADIDVLTGQNYGGAYYNDRTTGTWRVATATNYASVPQILQYVINSNPTFASYWNSDSRLGFYVADNGGSVYPLYSSPYAKLTSSNLVMGAGTTQGDTSNQFLTGPIGSLFTNDVLSPNPSATANPWPNAVIALDSVSTDISASGTAGDIIANPSSNPSAALRYIEGSYSGSEGTDIENTWGRRFPNYLEGLVLAIPGT